ncbi:MAG TPA: cyclic di-AMP binding protein CbpA [Candidatus Avipropionibacterium sp.]|nr:cyclic di-AMP binding protein CbpA [Candidatus Avipropionibacterium sp.]
MLVNNNYVRKRDVVFVRESDGMESALEKIVEAGYRCIPVLDDAREKYVGNVYKVDLLKKEVDGELDGPLSEVITDVEDGFVEEEAPFFKVFATIKRLPYLAVVDDEKTFLGILTNANVLDVLESSWDIENGSYSLTIGTIEYAGALRHMLDIINEYTSVQSVITLKDTLKFVRRLTVVLPKEVDEKTLKKITRDLEEANYNVIRVEELNF